MAILNVTNVAVGGVAAAPVTPAALGDEFDNADGKTLFQVTNDSGGSVNVTFTVEETVDGDLNVPDRVVAVAAGASKRFGPFRKSRYNNANDRVKAVCSATADVLVEAFRVGAS